MSAPTPVVAAPAPSTAATTPATAFNIQKELASLRHEKKNHDLNRLPPSTTIQRRPINHAPIADIHAGAHVPKCVYVSRHTPVMAAVKRVKKILREIERRAVQAAIGGGTRGGKPRSVARDGGERGVAQGVAKVNEVLRREREEVLVKASGRAMEQALHVAEWFRSKEKEVLCDVVVRTGSVSVVDDIVEVEVDQEVRDDAQKEGDALEDNESSEVECGETTLELLGDITTSTVPQNSATEVQRESEDVLMMTAEESQPVRESRKRKRRKKSTRPMYDKDDVPEARLRWVKTVEVAISLRA
ncbi:hypothetical protein LTR84_001499 [Exophiala bonariae]|uniref:Uncharacterized protein n=1 Tax=Exophiala bonariae TaxID=1690606 RepID=A0AAV9NCR6_9EURO|nr:hypothetical protein LTR84_001499 [Exophiala bonariae]